MALEWRGLVNTSLGRIYEKFEVDELDPWPGTAPNADQDVIVFASEPSRIYQRYDSGEMTLLRAATVLESVDAVLGLPETNALAAIALDSQGPHGILANILILRNVQLHGGDIDNPADVEAELLAVQELAVRVIVAAFGVS